MFVYTNGRYLAATPIHGLVLFLWTLDRVPTHVRRLIFHSARSSVAAVHDTFGTDVRIGYMCRSTYKCKPIHIEALQLRTGQMVPLTHQSDLHFLSRAHTCLGLVKVDTCFVVSRPERAGVPFVFEPPRTRDLVCMRLCWHLLSCVPALRSGLNGSYDGYECWARRQRCRIVLAWTVACVTFCGVGYIAALAR